MDITRRYLANQFDIPESRISFWVKTGVLPKAVRRGRHASYPPETPRLVRDLIAERERYATLQELAERRQLTGRLLAPDLDRGPV